MEQYPRLTWLPMLQRGCCCSLEVCCKLQGYLTLVFCVLDIVSCLALWATESNFCREYQPITPNMPSLVCGPFGVAFQICNFIYGLVVFSISVVMLAGISQRRGGMLTPYLVLQYINVILVIHVAVWFTFPAPVVSLFLTIPAIALNVYCLLCVNSLRAQFNFKAGGMQPLGQEFDNPLARPMA
ncbi:uncharacterized protein LOC113211649 [Frankliniella occidentalis]|uniref:Uncharacterized protein LOC113211649 n=1 Tax=Frankliniella occidentalis TaxID=133901 RepID=A0A6J1T5H4_FRAOC|nr:uncharacterized protein LOC113211649 [Frankliniella occidentalis]